MTLEEYEKSGHKAYARLASTVSAILAPAIATEPALRLQQLQARGKDPGSLGAKLTDRGLGNPPDVPAVVKDLAGCRAIFYTNTDVRAFERSGIIQANFEVDWDRTKVHHPLSPEDAPFISNNLVVRLKDDRTALPEYADLKGLWCELQIHTTLNHAWSEMEHDMVYKMPKVEGFGEKAMAQVKARLNAIMRNHLIPAGHEFSKVLHDFDRLRQGRELFDRDALVEIAEAGDNDQRLDRIERFASHVLPNYDDVQAVWPEVRATLLAAVETARVTEPAEIDTGFGVMPGATSDRVEAKVAEIFKGHRYLEVEQMLDDALALYASAPTDVARDQWLKVLKAVSENNIQVWRTYGPAVQLRLVEHLAKLSPERRNALRAPLLTVLGNALKTSASGAFAVSPDTVSLEEAALPASEALAQLRAEALRMLAELFSAADDDVDRAAIVSVFSAATRPPHNVHYSDAAHAALVRDAVEVVAFYSRALDGLSFELKQQIEHELVLLHHRYRALPEPAGAAVRAEVHPLLAAIVAFKDALNADPEFVIYKTLVGFRSVFPDAWTGSPFDPTRDRVHRAAMVAAYVGEVDAHSLPTWLERIQRCAATKSRDGATFPVFSDFLTRLGEAKPELVLSFIGGVDHPLARWIPALLQGLAKAGRQDDIDAQLDAWLAETRFIAEILRYLRFDDGATPARLRAAHAVAQEMANLPALTDAALAAVVRRSADSALIADVALPALTALSASGAFGWISELSYLEHKHQLEGVFEDADRRAVLDLIAIAPSIDYDDEMVLEVLTRGDRSGLFDLFEARFGREDEGGLEGGPRFEAIPFHFQLLADIPKIGDLALPLLERAYAWFKRNPVLFKYRGGRVVKNFYPTLGEPLQAAILALVDDGKPDGGEFGVDILRAYSGEAFPLEIARQLVSRLPEDSDAIEEIDIALSETGVVTGAFGFVEAYQAKRDALKPWLTDDSERVRAFAKRFLHRLSQRIAGEQQMAEESEALRRLAFEPPTPAAEPGPPKAFEAEA